MIKMTYCLRRRGDLKTTEFSAYWREHHGPLVRSLSSKLRIVRYVQVHPLEPYINAHLADHRGTPAPYDGVAELWWESVEDFLSASRSASGRAAANELLRDERRFIDLEQSPLWLSEEETVLDESRPT